ncbi:MAG: heavy metal translocating P-type ATPase [Algicola sp.]|nr:heavy metal translocating P-type ATPase [Algicola sp.]
MIIQIVALGGILYTGYRQYKKEQSKSAATQQISKKGFYEKKVEQIYQNVNDGGSSVVTVETPQEQSFEVINNREIKVAATGFGLAVAGLFYKPLGLLSIPCILYAGKLVIKEAFKLLRKGKIDLETLVAALILGTVFLQRFMIASFSILMFKLSLRLTSKVIQDSRNHLVDIFSQAPEFVWVLVDDVEVSVPFNKVNIGDIVIVQAGDTIPVDGKVHEGMASVDQHILTGEAVPADKGPGEDVYAMTIVLSGRLLIEVEKAGEESTAAKITQILNQTADYKSGVQLRAETVSRDLINPALIAGSLSLPVVGWSGAIGVLACHPANSLTTIAPITILKHLTYASQQGILVKDGRSLELLGKVDTIVFDKTGTLTEEQPHTGAIHALAQWTEDEVLSLACSAEYKQTHPLAKAIQAEAKKRQIEAAIPSHCEYKLGYGLLVTVEGKTVHVGSERFMTAQGIELPAQFETLQGKSRKEGYSLVMVAVDNTLAGAIELRPTIRAEAQAVINQLKRRGTIKHFYIISGDGEVPTRELANTLGIDNCFWEVLPENKAALIKQLQQNGHFVCFVGDGINDSIALKTAQVSVSLTGASKIATDTAQIVLLDGGIKHLDFLFDIGVSLDTKMDGLLKLMLAPSIAGVCAIFLLGAGISTAIALGTASMVASVGYVLLPVSKRIQAQLDKKQIGLTADDRLLPDLKDKR